MAYLRRFLHEQEINYYDKPLKVLGLIHRFLVNRLKEKSKYWAKKKEIKDVKKHEVIDSEIWGHRAIPFQLVRIWNKKDQPFFLGTERAGTDSASLTPDFPPPHLQSLNHITSLNIASTSLHSHCQYPRLSYLLAGLLLKLSN